MYFQFLKIYIYVHLYVSVYNLYCGTAAKQLVKKSSENAGKYSMEACRLGSR